jgi:adenine-specific DNA-methyltransferase
MRYIGSKDNLLPFIAQTLHKKGISSVTAPVFCDIFSGTTVVARHFKQHGFKIVSCDLMTYSYVFQKAYIENNAYPQFTRLLREVDFAQNAVSATSTGQLALDFSSPQDKSWSLQQVCTYLNLLPGQPGFFYNNYAPDGTAEQEYQRMYLSSVNASRLDAVRETIEQWHRAGWLEPSEYYLLVAMAIEALPFVANISGTYGAFLKRWDTRALKPIRFATPLVLESTLKHQVFQGDANHVITQVECDILYLDPPYNARQYATNYHLLETVAAWDNPAIYGKTGLRPYEHQKSDYCESDKATKALQDLLDRARCRHILISYNSEGLIPETELLRILGERGKVEVFRLPYRRFRSDVDSEKRQYKPVDEVSENLYYVSVKKPPKLFPNHAGPFDITLGWVQDAGDFGNLRKAVEVLAKGPQPRKAYLLAIQVATGVGRWADDNFARMAHALGLVAFDRSSGLFSLKEAGLALVATSVGSEDELEVLRRQLLVNPPVVRVLSLLKSGEPLTKFELGAEIGFYGEGGFSKYPQDIFVEELAAAKNNEERSQVRQNREGSCDKYARTIAGWLSKAGWLVKVPKEVRVRTGKQEIVETLDAYRITGSGLTAINRALGTSRYERVTKFVPPEMLCSGKQPNADQLRPRRVALLEILGKGGSFTARQLARQLESLPVPVLASERELATDLLGLQRCGINIVPINQSYSLRDSLDIEPLPQVTATNTKNAPAASVAMTARVLNDCPQISQPQYLWALDLVPYSFDGRSARFLEVNTERLFRELLGFQTQLLGAGNTIQPDVLAWCNPPSSSGRPYALIIDCKATKDGYSLPSDDRRAMQDYLAKFANTLRLTGSQAIYFLFVTSALKGNLERGLQDVLDRSGHTGSVISVEDLLWLADKLLGGQLNQGQLERVFDGKLLDRSNLLGQINQELKN